MSVSIKLYSVSEADHLPELKDIQAEYDNAFPKTFNLDQMDPYLALILVNKIDPYEDQSALGFKMLYGNQPDIDVDDLPLGGFISTSEVKVIVDWFQEYKLDSLEGFLTYCQNLSPDVLAELEDLDCWPFDLIFNDLFHPLTNFYLEAKNAHNSILLFGS